jgi:hypothetical protein
LDFGYWILGIGYSPINAFILIGILRSLLRGFQVLAKSVPEATKFRNTPSACGGDRNFEDFASLLGLVPVWVKIRKSGIEYISIQVKSRFPIL